MHGNRLDRIGEPSARDAQSGRLQPVSAAAATDLATASSGMRAYVDPQTGEFAAPPQGSAPPAIASPSSGTGRSAAVWNSPVPGGGQMIDTHGQFLHAMKAQAGPAGVVIGCEDANAATQTGTER